MKEDHVSECPSLRVTVATFWTGCLCSTTFLWCYIFRALLTFTLFETVASSIYSWYMLILYIAMMIMCSWRYNQALHDTLPMIGWVNMLITTLTFACCSYRLLSEYTVPFLFISNATLLCLLVPTTIEVVYLCQTILHNYFEAGFYLAVIVYYGLVATGAFETPIFLVPFSVYICIGMYAFSYLKTSQEYYNALEKYRAIFVCGGKKFITFKASDILYVIAKEITFSLLLCICINAVIVAAAIHTDVLRALGSYVFLMYFGAFCCGGLKKPSHTLTVCFAISACISASLLFGIYSKDVLASTVLFLLCFFFYVNALNCEFAIMLQKLHKGVNAPKIVLFFNLLCNFFVSLNLMITLKLFQ
ncbi:hypothetical protein KM481_gp55 [Harp seal herpesvirus]|uniref:Envelope protein UL43 n=1 Tax=phocid gammaherpesvirus 3 TaxID=2560643 RepID=A0A0R5YD91_9GAMA|nr:hypothetical protein KM481_gp55 [Harp seal herpesvirus]AJG42985.1 hypothetical protein [Harp seal herpesvirus]